MTLSGKVVNTIRPFLQRFEVDRAVFFGILTKIWQSFSGLITALLIATRFTPELQGYYYTFVSLLALQVFVQLGLGTVIIQFASHEWSKLYLDGGGQILGNANSLSRLISLGSIAFRWYIVTGVLAVFGLGFGGYYFFSVKTAIDSNIIWLNPWLFLCLFTGVTIILVPIWSLLEGCNQVGNVYMFRFIEGLARSIPLWCSILLGAELWTPVISSFAGVLMTVIFFRQRYWHFIKTILFSKPSGPIISWGKEILPMQWRIAVSWLSGYFVFFMFTPVLFQYHGPTVAGQMGMTWSLIVAISSISSAWIAPKTPYFGILIAKRKYIELDKLFWRLLSIVFVVVVLGSLCTWSIVLVLNELEFALIDRILPPLPMGIFLLATIIMVISTPFSAYLRAHKKEVTMIPALFSAIIVLTSNLTLGKYFGVTGMALGYLGANILVKPFFYLIWSKCRSEWHCSTQTVGV
jgi:hypothetical protein